MNYFIRDALREKLAAIKVIEYRDVDHETAKAEVVSWMTWKKKAGWSQQRQKMPWQ